MAVSGERHCDSGSGSSPHGTRALPPRGPPPHGLLPCGALSVPQRSSRSPRSCPRRGQALRHSAGAIERQHGNRGGKPETEPARSYDTPGRPQRSPRLEFGEKRAASCGGCRTSTLLRGARAGPAEPANLPAQGHARCPAKRVVIQAQHPVGRRDGPR